MTNHVHSIITPPDEEALSKMMKRLCQRYAQERNQKRDASGKVFEERYRSKVIEDDAQMMFTMLYNDANGYHAGLVTIRSRTSGRPCRSTQAYRALGCSARCGRRVLGTSDWEKRRARVRTRTDG